MQLEGMLVNEDFPAGSVICLKQLSTERADKAIGMIEIKNVPANLVLFALQQWKPCQRYAKTGRGNNTNTFIKGISVWLILKSATTSGNIQNYRSQLPTLAEKCRMSVRTFEKYLAWLNREGLVHTGGKNLLLCNYNLLKKYKINIQKRLPTFYYHTDDNKNMAEILVTIGIAIMQQRWMQVYWNKLNQNPDEYKRLYDFRVYIKADASRLSDPEYFRQCHLNAIILAYQEEKPGQPAYEFLHKHLAANPDLNCRASTYARKLGYSAAMSFCHLKFKLKKRGLIEVEKGHVESECRSRKDEKMFHHRWLNASKNTIWFRCDQITVHSNAIFNP